MPFPFLIPLPVYPVLPGLGFNVKWQPQFYNQSQQAQSGAQIDISLAQYPLHSFELTYELLRDIPNGSFTVSPFNEFKTLMLFFATVGGQAGRWLFDNPDDDSVLQGLQSIGDGQTTTFPLLSPFGWPVGYPQAVPNIYLNGTLQPTSSYTITYALGLSTVTFNTAPAAGVVITADITYYYYCKFTADVLLFEKFTYGRWLAQSVKFMSCRPGA